MSKADNDHFMRLFMATVELNTGAVEAVIAMGNQLLERRVLDKTDLTEVAAMLHSRMKAAETVLGRPMPGLAKARAALDRWSDPS